MLREEGTPIYNLDDDYIKDSEFFYNKYKSMLKDKDIYVVTSKFYRDSEKALKMLEDKNFQVIEKVAEYNCNTLPYIGYMDEWEIYKIRYKYKN